MPLTRPHALTLTLLMTAASLACSGGSATMDPDGARQDATADSGGVEAAGGEDAGVNDGAASDTDGGGLDGGNRFAMVEATLVAEVAAAGLSAIGLAIWNAQDQKVYEHMVGSFTADTRVAVASASKLVAGLVVLDVIGRNKLRLDSTTGDVLGWTGANAGITLRHLLSFTSGLPREASCTLNPLTTTAACAATLASSAAVAPPGTRFDYGSTHLLVAAAMAEQATGQRFSELFATTLRAPLGLPDAVAYYTLPRQEVGLQNPLIAGGLRASMNEYARLLAVAFHRGRYGGLAVGSPALFEEQAREPFPGVVVGHTPWPGTRYGLASWLECDTPATGCAVLASPGAFGFTPWVDRTTGYYAILGTELTETGTDDGVPEAVIKIQQALLPVIATALAR